MYKKIKLVITFISKEIGVLLDKVLILIFGILIVFVAVNVILRYIFQMPLFAVTELANYLLVYLVFLGAADALYKNEHVHIDIEHFRMPSKWRRAMSKARAILNMVFIIVLVFYGRKLAVMNKDSFTGVLAVPMGIVYVVIPISGCIMMIQYLYLLLHPDLLQEKKEQETS